MTRKQDSAKKTNWKELMSEQEDFLRPLIREILQEVLETEMDDTVGAEKGERYQRSEKALVGAMTEMYVQGVSTRKVKAITEELCGHEVSASTISRLNVKLDEELERFATRRLSEAFPYLILDARYEKVREDGVITNQAVMIAIGVDWEGRRNVLAVELANRESQSSWKEFCLALKQRGLQGVELVISDDHAGLRKAIAEVFTEAAWQRCYVHFLRNASTICRGKPITTA